MLERFKQHLNKYTELYLILIALLISIISFMYFYFNGQMNLVYGDAVSRLNISRKLFDNLTPGIGQLGSVWLPLPHIIMSFFVFNDYLWHTGLGGYILSGISFIVLVLYLYKLGILAFDSKFAGLMMAGVALININIIYMQTTAMTEIFFLATVVLSTYYLLLWAKNLRISYLMIAAVFVSASTLIRYEGYFILAFAILLVGIISIIKFKNKKIVEGQLILFTTLAITGFIFWCIYCGAIFKDPFYWKAVYSGEKAVVSTENIEPPTAAVAENKKDIINTVSNYTSAGLQMNGLIVTSVAILSGGGYCLYLVISKKGLKNPEKFIILLPLASSLFVIYSAYNGFPLELPLLNIHALTDRSTTYAHEYNIRYGLNLFPFVAIFLGFLASRRKYVKFFVLFIILLQLITTVGTSFYTIYQLPLKFSHIDNLKKDDKLPALYWLKQNYNGGLIIISAYKHDPDMFHLDLPYKRYIHEGTGKYWIESMKEPQKYATWIYMYTPGPGSEQSDEPVTKNLGNNPNLKQYFDKMYEEGNVSIYKIKTHPEIEIKN